MPTRLQIAKRDIVAELDRQPTRVFSARQIASILSEHREYWRLAQRTTVPDFITFLARSAKLREIELYSPSYTSVRRYVWGDASKMEIALSVKPNAYLSHGTAIFLHNLTNEVPRTFYINQEQSPKPAPRSALTQDGIDRAFRNKQRISNLTYEFDGTQVVVIAGKNTGRLEVAAFPGPTGETLPATKLERTLIDSAVRPVYAGGVSHVLEAFAGARSLVSTNVLLATLKKLGYVYPYHQAIGFFMQRAEYEPAKYSRLKDLGVRFNFYLAHGIVDPAYDEEWKLFYPKGL